MDPPPRLFAVMALTTSTPGSAAATTRGCADVDLTSNSDDLASSVRARGVTCRVARRLIRAADGRPGERFRGYRCTSKKLATELPARRYRCVSGDQLIRWVKT